MITIPINKDFVLGCDETASGALVGSFFVAGVRAPKDWKLPGLNDSKKLSPQQRETMRAKLLPLIDNNTIFFYLAERTHTQIDTMGYSYALNSAYVEVFQALYQPDTFIITDGQLFIQADDIYERIAIPKADGTYPTVMAASILAKTHADAVMLELDKQYPQYNWKKNLGYAHEDHLQAIEKYGGCPLHRQSYSPFKQKNKNKQQSWKGEGWD